MGQKVNPNFMRIGINKHSSALWYADRKKYADYLNDDLYIRSTIKEVLKGKQVSEVRIKRKHETIMIDISGAAIPLILGKGNVNIKKILFKLKKVIKKTRIEINAHEVKNINANAQLIANHIARQLENRVSFRYAQKSAIRNAKFANVLGIKTQVSGRLNGADMARREGYSFGKLPLQTFDSRIDYATAIAHTTYGCTGVKVWVCNKERQYGNFSGKNHGHNNMKGKWNVNTKKN